MTLMTHKCSNSRCDIILCWLSCTYTVARMRNVSQSTKVKMRRGTATGALHSPLTTQEYRGSSGALERPRAPPHPSGTPGRSTLQSPAVDAASRAREHRRVDADEILLLVRVAALRLLELLIPPDIVEDLGGVHGDAQAGGDLLGEVAVRVHLRQHRLPRDRHAG